jgi:hypothetical protein
VRFVETLRGAHGQLADIVVGTSEFFDENLEQTKLMALEGWKVVGRAGARHLEPQATSVPQ